MENRNGVQFRERTTISLPAGTQGRVRTAAAARGMKAAHFLRQAVLDRLEKEERTAQQGRDAESASNRRLTDAPLTA
jgi:hypothetical protein